MSEHIKIMVPKDEMFDVLGSDDVISDEIVDHGRWTVSHALIFKRDGKIYETYYDVGATESQDQCPWEYEDEVECFEVREQEVTKVEYVRIEK